ncbi:MAG: metalloregulator ArsR/SmtB family transcription factor [Bauldia sp.]
MAQSSRTKAVALDAVRPADRLDSAALLTSLKAVGEPTRLRILALLAEGELTVKDLTAILAQSQPRISRHMKLLAESGLVERNPEGTWVYYRLADEGTRRRLSSELVALLDVSSPPFAADRDRLAAIKLEREQSARRYFDAHADEWEAIRSLHVADDRVEASMRAAIGTRPFQAMLDLGTGTGRLLEVFADLYNKAVGVDSSAGMLAMARANLERAGITQAQVRLGDAYALPLPRGAFDLVTIHQVLHFLDDPQRVIAEAARVLRPGGRLLIVDFAPHELEFLREHHAHRRLGFTHEAVRGWLEGAGLEVQRIEDLTDGKAGRGDRPRLAVTLWLARDPRVLMTDAEPSAGRGVVTA